MILVVGATGLVGSDICRRLAARGDSVRALVRPSADPARVLALHDAGVETLEGDLRDRVSLEAACRDVSAVIETAAAMPFSFVPGINDIRTTDIAGVESLFAAAETAGVTHAVYLSFSGQIDLDFPLRNAKRRIEERLRQSGLTHTILRPSFFMEAWLGPAVGFDAANATAVVYGDGTMPVSWVSSGDVAELTVRCLRNPAARDATIEMGGPEALPPLEVVEDLRGDRGAAVRGDPRPDRGACGAGAGGHRRHGPLLRRPQAVPRPGRRDPDGGVGADLRAGPHAGTRVRGGDLRVGAGRGRVTPGARNGTLTLAGREALDRFVAGV